MSTISVPLSEDMESSVNNLIKSGYGSNKADVIRRAIKKAVEDEAVEAILRAEKEFEDGKALEGDLEELANKIS